MQVRAVFEQMGRKAVAQRMRCDLLVDLRGLLIVLDDLPKALSGNAAAVQVDEQGLLVRLGDHIRPDIRHIGRQGTDGSRVDRDDAGLPVPDAADKAACQTDVRNVQGDHLADAHAGGIERLKHGLVAVALHIRTLRLFEQQLDLAAGQNLRKALFRLLLRDIMHRRLRDRAGGDAVAIEALERRHTPGDRCGRLADARQMAHIGTDRLLRARLQRRAVRLLQIGGELPHIAQIGSDRIVRCVPDIHKVGFICSHELPHLAFPLTSKKLCRSGPAHTGGNRSVLQTFLAV